MLLRPFVLAAFVASAFVAAQAQVLEIRTVEPESAATPLTTLKFAQTDFESFRRRNLPTMTLSRPNGGCDDYIGAMCYTYDETPLDLPREPRAIGEARARLIARLDSAALRAPEDRWVVAALVRYLTESGRNTEALAAAKRCAAPGWWCEAVRGFALHVAERYAESDSVWSVALNAMDDRTRCEWVDLKRLLDDELLKDYRAGNCAQRAAYEARLWWLARPMMSSNGNDARTEYLSRRFFAETIKDTPSGFEEGFSEDERELLLRYGWPRAWARGRQFFSFGSRESIVGYEPSPSPPMMPVATSVKRPAFSDSLSWRGKGFPGTRARYAPSYATYLGTLTHQSAIFRRADSALVVLAYDATADKRITGGSGPTSAALVLTKGEPGDAVVVRSPNTAAAGTLIARTTWGPILMSAEVANASQKALARARYGIRASDNPGSRVSISDLLFFDPYDGLPSTLEEAIAHARSSFVLPAKARVGIYWETYNTNPRGEGMRIAITVTPVERDAGLVERGLTALRLQRESQPVSIAVDDVSARGNTYSPRAVVVDLATLRSGQYVLQVEISAENTLPVRTERTISVR